jgi:hypothetical protein
MMAGSKRLLKGKRGFEVAEKEDLVSGILEGVEDYKKGRVKNFKTKEELLDHLRSL